MKSTPDTKHLKDVWRSYALDILATNKDLWGRYHNKTQNYYIYRSITVTKGTLYNNIVVDRDKKVVECVFDYSQFKRIIDEFFIQAKVAIIEGKAINLTNNVGKICARRVVRNHKNKQVNWGRTNMQEKVLNEEGKLVPKKTIYHTEDEYCRLGYHKTGKITNESVYEFCPTEDNDQGTGFKQQFTKALNNFPLLKYKYLYFPLTTEIRRKLKKEILMYNKTKDT